MPTLWKHSAKRNLISFTLFHFTMPCVYWFVLIVPLHSQIIQSSVLGACLDTPFECLPKLLWLLLVRVSKIVAVPPASSV